MEVGENWEYRNRLFDENQMYIFLETAAGRYGLFQTRHVLPLVRRWHQGQTRKGAGQVPYIIHPLTMACHALALGIREDDILAAVLLHDVCEDCGVEPEELPVGENVRRAVELVTFSVRPGEDRAAAKRRYYEDIGGNREASIVKAIDRCNNLSLMAGAFSRERMADYIEETERYVIPLLDQLRSACPEFYSAVFLLDYQMGSMMETLKRLLPRR